MIYEEISNEYARSNISLKRSIFFFFYNVFGRFLPRTTMPYNLGSKKIRAFLVRNFIEYCGDDIQVETGAILSPTIQVGNRCLIGEHCRIRGKVIIGDDVLFAQNVNVIAFNHNFERDDIPIRVQGESFGSITIGNDVWLGINSTILNDVTVGNHAIIGVGSVVTKNVPEWAIVGGVPANVIKYRPRSSK